MLSRDEMLMPLKCFSLPLITPRLQVREFVADDEDALFALESDPKVKEFSDKFTATREEFALCFRSKIRHGLHGDEYLAIESLQGRELIGRCGVLRKESSDPNGRPTDEFIELQIFLSSLGLGLGTEVANLLIENLFAIGAEVIYANTSQDNCAARRMITENCGFARHLNDASARARTCSYVLTSALYEAWKDSRSLEVPYI